MTINFSNKWIRITMHVLVWAILISLPYLMNVNRSRPPRPLSLFEERQFLKLNWINYIYWMGLFYLNGWVLVPKLLYRKKYLLYSVLFIVLLALVMVSNGFLFNALLPGLKFNLRRLIWFSTPTFVLTMAASTAYKLIADRIGQEKRILQREQENMKTELSFLRSQISPHFIFNILNNIVALVRLKSNELEPTVMKLSGLMQYMLYETDEEKVSIRTETEYLQAYIDLQQQRFGKKVHIEANMEVLNEFAEIEPMLLIPFIENAFKHGTGLIEEPSISIHLKTDAKKLYFSVRNKFNPESNETKDSSSGIGLTNVSRRLNLLYAENHELLIKTQYNWFEVDLSLTLNT